MMKSLFFITFFCILFSSVLSSNAKEQGIEFLENVSKQAEIYKLKSGLLIQIIENGNNPEALSPTFEDSCDVTYSGFLIDGSSFDSGTTMLAPNMVIPGWTEALQLMSEGDKWKLYIPEYLGYGEEGASDVIPPYSTLVFDLELTKVHGQNAKSVAEARTMFSESIADDSPQKMLKSQSTEL